MNEIFITQWIFKKRNKKSKKQKLFNIRLPNSISNELYFENGNYLIKIFKLDFGVDKNEN